MKQNLLKLLLTVTLLLTVACAAVGEEIYSGTHRIDAPWTLGPSVYTVNAGGDFDPARLTEGTVFTVRYTGTEGAVYLALAEWETGVWAQADAPASTVRDGDALISTFTYDQMRTAYGADDLSSINAVCVGTASSTEAVTVLSIAFEGGAPEAEDEPAEASAAPVTLFRGSMKGSGKNAWLTCLYTAHAGGAWDASVINAGSALRVTYAGPEGGIVPVLGSVSGGKNWAQPRVSSRETDNGIVTDTYTVSAMQAAYGSDFARLDELILLANADSVTLRRVEYLPGTGEPLTVSDGTWLAGGTGIAVIGDSIVQNADNFGRWTGILGRNDCDNFGIGGQTTRHCLKRIGAVASFDYDAVILLAGINDVGAGIPADETAANLRAMADAVLEKNPDCRVICVSVLPTTPAFYKGMQDRITAINDRLQVWAAEDDRVTYADCYSLFLGEDGYCQPGLVSDGLHPNSEGYRVIGGVLQELLN